MHGKEAKVSFDERLKDNVCVVFSGDRAKVAYALWEVELPASWVTTQPVINDLLNRRISRGQALKDPTAKPLVELLSAQGCFTSVVKSHYSLEEVKVLFAPLRSEWYAAYYAHPTWELIRSGTANRNVLLAWLIHNYHISRAAGIVAARMAATGKSKNWQTFFRQDALEEYWHCDAFYSLNTPLLQGLSVEDVKASLPLPGSLAFEEHCLQIAESNPLGHVLIAYFQESSIAFADDSDDFYGAVEEQYAIQGLFDSWKQHIQIDVDHDHADGLGKLLDSTTRVTADELEHALRNAWLGFYFLYCSLDEIQHEQHDDGLFLRRPIDQIVAAAPPNLWQALANYLATKQATPPFQIDEADQAYLLEGISRSAFRALGFAREHDQIIACGGIANAFSSLAKQHCSAVATNPWSVAIVNHLLEAANTPFRWLLLISLLTERISLFKLSNTVESCVEKALRNCALGSGTCHQPLSVLKQLDELIAQRLVSLEQIPHPLLQI